MDRNQMNIAIYGPGRVGGAIVLAAVRAGHHITAVDGRNRDAVAKLLSQVSIDAGQPDITFVTVTDDALVEVATDIAARWDNGAAVHVSGALGLSVLEPIAQTGADTGSFHPLATFPDSLQGAKSLPGSWVAITASEPLRSLLFEFAISLGCQPFDLEDDMKALYHAAASVAANYTTTTLDLAERLFLAAGVPFEAARPLVESAVTNAFEMGPMRAMTGPVARGDVATVESQLSAIRDHVPEVIELFEQLTRATAARSETEPEIRGALQ